MRLAITLVSVLRVSVVLIASTTWMNASQTLVKTVLLVMTMLTHSLANVLSVFLVQIVKSTMKTALDHLA